MDKVQMGRVFAALFDRVELEAITGALGDSSLRYYDGVVEASDLSEQLTAVRLLKESVESRLLDSSDIRVKTIRQNLADYHRRLAATVEFVSRGKPVPRIMHFVWVGGSEVGQIQRDYMNIWRSVLAPQGYKFNLWYDSDAVLAFEMNRVILDSARVHAMESGGATLTDSTALSRMIEDRARVLKQQMFAHLNQPQWTARKDAARVDFMVRAYGKDRGVLEAFRQKCLESHQAMEGTDLRLRDAREEFAGHFLHDVYEREVAMRGNFAAASDVVRLQAEFLEGGRYSDVDYLPPLIDKPGGVDISGFSADAKIGVLQLLLNHDEELMPGRDRQRYADRTHLIPGEHLEALRAFAKSRPGVANIFIPPQETLAPRDAIRLGTARGILSGGEMNAHFLAHPGSAMTYAIMQMIRLNYDCLYEAESRLLKAGGTPSDAPRLEEIAIKVIAEMQAEGRFPKSTFYGSQALAAAMVNYYRDGIRLEARGTITLTGPGAASAGLIDYVEKHLQSEHLDAIRKQLKLIEGYNVFNEEEMVSGWTVNGTPEEWLAKEQEKWATGKLKSRYMGNLSELMKEQTLTFKEGWPVIEGKPVLLTSVLQQLLDNLGEPFIRAMNDRLSGDIALDGPFFIDFDTRQQILQQPVSELPISSGAESLGNLNEALSRIATGKLPVDQLSPLHRVMFGGLFGASTLDQDGFAAAWKTTVDFAGNTHDLGLFARYDVIEQTLLKRYPAQAESAASRVGPVEQNSTILKAQAFAKPMSVRQWRDHVSRVTTLAKNEYRASILTRGNAVHDLFFRSGANSARQLPQDLLVRGAGDPGWRCYPLALVMAAAVEKGFAAERALIGKLAIANIAPDTAETHALLHVLDELRGIPMAQFGKKRPAANLHEIMQALDAKTTTGSLLINTESHSMLVSKIAAQGEISYRFYDPNFSLYEFSRIDQLHQGLQDFLQDEVIARLYGVVEGPSAVFDVVDLNGARIADMTLPSSDSVGRLLSNEPIAGGTPVEPWRHHAELRLRSLSENARLGQAFSSAQARKWGRTIESATYQLHDKHQLSRDFVPLFESLKPAAGAQSEITLINSKDLRQTRTVLTDDKRLSGIKSYLSHSFEQLSGIHPDSPAIDPTDIGGVHTLNAGFAIQTLLLGLKETESGTDSTTLTSAVRIHGYLAYAQLSHGLVIDAAQLLALVRHAFTDSLRVANTSSAIVGRALSNVLNDGVGNVLQLASIGFDIYLLINAENDAQRAVFATQLAFDSAGLVLGAGAFGAGALGAGTAAAFLGGASVVLGGLAIGIGALVEGFSARTERGKQIGRYLNKVHEAYRSAGYSIIGDTLHANPYAVYSCLDLRNGSITFGSQKMLAADDYSDLHPPKIDPDRELAFSIREALDLPERFVITDERNIESVVLPSLPDCFLGYGFGGLPFSTTLREDLETALALEYDRSGKRQFWFSFYKVPTEYIIEKMVPSYVATTVNVVLGRQHRFLHVPTLPREVHGHLSYDIDALGGHCSITLTEGVKSLRLQVSTDEAMSWSIRAAWLNKRAVKIEGDLLQLGSINVQVPGKNVVFLQLDGHSYQVGWANETLLLTELEAGPDEDGSVTRQRVRELARSSHLTEGPTMIRNYHDALTGVRTTAWYDRSEDSFLLVRGLEPKYAADICMGPRIGQHVYYYCPSEALVWRVDVITGQIKRVYRLVRTELKAWISDVQQLPDGQLRVIRRIELDEYQFLKMTYLIGEDELSITSVSGYLSYRVRRDILLGSITVADFLEWYRLLPAESGVDDERVVDAGLSRFITVDYMDWHLKKFHRVWVRSSDGKVFRPILDARDDLADVFDWELLDPQQSEDDTVLFRSLSHHLLYRQHIGGQHQIPATYAEIIVPLRVQQINRLGQQYIVITEEGMVFHMNALGESRLAGLSKDWQFARRYYSSARLSWWDAVLNTAEKWSSENVEVGGIGDTSGNTFLYVVCLGRQFLVADTAGKALKLLRPTQDHKAVWLLDSSSGRIYRQAFMGQDSLSEAFGAGTRLFRADLVPTMQRVLPQRTFAWAVPHASGLRAKTHDHILFDLFEGEPPRIVGVENEFFESVDSRQVREQKLAQLLTGQHSAPFLFMDRIDDLCSWYDVSAGRLLRATAPSNVLPGYLGVANGQTLLLHDPVNQQLFSNRSEDGLLSDVWMTVDAVSRDANTLVIERGQPLGRMAPIPDGVDTLILRYAKDGADFLITQKTWARLDCLIVDFDFPDAVRSYLMLKLAPMERWLVTLEAGHLLLTDPDTGRSIILRNAGTINVASQKQVVFSIPLSGDLEVTLHLDELMAALQENTPSDFGALISLSVEA